MYFDSHENCVKPKKPLISENLFVSPDGVEPKPLGHLRDIAIL